MIEVLITNLNTVGLIFNIVGTLFIAFYIRKDPKEWVEGEGKPGEKWFSPIIYHPCWFRLGIILLGLGFSFSLIDSILR